MSKKISVSNLEFDEIKANLKEFLSAQSEFSDHNFEGSGLAVLLDVLAYNTHYNALYDNMMVNESFLDSASKRDSVVSRAADLGYVPRSAKCSRMTVDLTFAPVGNVTDAPGIISVSSYSPFKSNTAFSSYTFYNPETILLKKTGSNYVATGVTLLAGKATSFSYTYTDQNTRFVLPNQGVDVDTIKVKVFESASLSSRMEVYTLADSVVEVKGDSKVYWIREIDNFLYELRFGDDIIGKKLSEGNMIVVDYMLSYGAESNGIRSIEYAGNRDFIYSGSLTMTISPSVRVMAASFGGSDIESIESIKFNAPRYFSSQNRAVTTEDYRSLVLSHFPDARSVSVWGGEDNYPAEYGKVFVCVAQDNFKKLTNVQITEIQNVLRSKKVVSIVPVIINAKYIELLLDVTVYYNERESARNQDDIKSLVIQSILNYNDTELEDFNGVFRYSKLTKVIDQTERSIANSNVSIKMRREVEPRYNISAEYTINIINPIKPGTFNSTGFYTNFDENVYYMDDDGLGNVRLYYYNDINDKIVQNSSIGKIDYSKGFVTISQLTIVALSDMTFRVAMEPASKDIVSALDQITRVVEDELNVTVIPDKTTLGDLRAGYNYNFS